MQFFWIFFLLQVLVSFLFIVPVPVPVPVLDQTGPGLWYRSRHISCPSLVPGSCQNFWSRHTGWVVVQKYQKVHSFQADSCVCHKKKPMGKLGFAIYKVCIENGQT